jgi:hypothetical protein
MLYPSMLEFSIFPERTINAILDYDEVAMIWARENDCVVIFSEKEYACLRKLCDDQSREDHIQERNIQKRSIADFLKDPKITIDDVIDNEEVVFIPAREGERIVVLCEKAYKALLGALTGGEADDYI